MNVVQVKYKELLSISMEQLFYQNQICSKYKVEPSLDFALVATTECEQVMKRLDLLFRNSDTTGGGTVLARVSGQNGGGDDLLRFVPKKGDKLSFLIYLIRPDLLNFNDLPSLAKDQFFYFTNQLSDPTALRSHLHLSKDATGVKGFNDVKKKVTEIYRFQNNAEIIPGNEKVRHLLTGVEIGSKSLINQGGKSDLIFDLSVLPSGICQLFINNILKEEFYYLGKTSPQAVFGAIELVLTSDLDSNYRITEVDGSIAAAKPVFKIRFLNRPTLWRYTLKLQPTSALYREMALLSPAEKTDFLNRLNIVSNDTNITFQKITATDTDLVFVSDNAISLQEAYTSSSSPTNENLSLSLKKYIGDLTKEASVKSNLPYPSTSLINTANAPIIYSDTFITI